MDAAIAETHLSVVVFLGERAYKLKKPVATAFADFSTREARRAACEREVELNRRLAPDVYLGVADVFGPDGSACDHLVVMRRMPQERRLSTLVARGADLDDELEVIAQVVVDFHAAAACTSETAAAATVDAVRRHWTDNATEMRPFVGSVLDTGVFDEVSALALRYLAGRARLFEQRIANGRSRDGHGDLLADDIFCLEDGPRILDCIEFDDQLRYGDVLADAAFLVMDLERLGRHDLGARFLASYAERSGDRWPSSLAHHYIGYRAQVRSKVACLRHEQGDPTAADAAASLLGLALDHLRRARVRLVLVGGLPGSGKSTLAAALGDVYGWPVLRSDVIRKELAGLSVDEPAAAEFGEGLYTPEAVDRTYRELVGRAESRLGLGEPVILDASWTHGRHRALAHDVARRTSVDLVEIRCEAPDSLRAQRMATRVSIGRDASDANAAIGQAMASAADPWPSAVPVATTGSVATSVDAARRALDGGEP